MLYSEFDNQIKFLIKDLHINEEHSINIVTADKKQGRSTFLKEVEKNVNNSDILTCSIYHKNSKDPVFECYIKAIQQILIDASNDIWIKFHNNLRKNFLLKNKSIHQLYWIYQNKRSLKKYNTFTEDLFSTQNFKVLHLKRILNEICSNRKFLFIIDNIEHYLELERTFHYSFLDLYESRNKFHFLLSARPTSRFSGFYKELVSSTDVRKIRVFYLRPFSYLNPEDSFKDIHTPIIPGIVDIENVNNLKDNEVYIKTITDPYYANIEINLPQNENTLLLTGLIHLFGGIRESDFQEIKKHGLFPNFKIGIEVKEKLWNIEGEWKFLDGWQEFLSTRLNHESVIEQLEKFVLSILDKSIVSPNIINQITLFNKDKKIFWLNPKLTEYYFDFFSIIKDLGKLKRKGNDKRHRERLDKLVDLFIIQNISISTEFVGLIIHMYEKTYNLFILDIGLQAMQKESQKIDYKAAYPLLLTALIEAKKWTDTRLIDYSFNVACLIAKKYTGDIKNFALAFEMVFNLVDINRKEQLKEIINQRDNTLDYGRFKELFSLFTDEALTQLLINELMKQNEKMNKIRPFIVHGHDNEEVLKLKDFLQNKVKTEEPIILHQQPGLGRTIIEKFEDYSSLVNVAIILITPDDVGGKNGKVQENRARQNVIFELGYFSGKLGRKRVILLLKGNVEIPSDLLGVSHIEMNPDILSISEKIRDELNNMN
jgi:predicted nucleotide-binding protein